MQPFMWLEKHPLPQEKKKMNWSFSGPKQASGHLSVGALVLYIGPYAKLHMLWEESFRWNQSSYYEDFYCIAVIASFPLCLSVCLSLSHRIQPAERSYSVARANFWHDIPPEITPCGWCGLGEFRVKPLRFLAQCRIIGDRSSVAFVVSGLLCRVLLVLFFVLTSSSQLSLCIHRNVFLTFSLISAFNKTNFCRHDLV